MEADRGITIVSPNLHLVADLYRQVGVEDVDYGVLGVESAKTGALQILQYREGPARY
jgi:hypothetical protein